MRLVALGLALGDPVTRRGARDELRGDSRTVVNVDADDSMLKEGEA